MRLPRLAAFGCLGVSLLLSGCYDEADPDRSVRTPVYDDAAPEVDTAGASVDTSDTSETYVTEDSRTYGNSGSTLGKAKDSAKRTIGDLEARDRELQKQIDDQ